MALTISPRRFEGWEPTEHTVVTRWDDKGRPAEWDTTREPEWDAEDRAFIYALLDMKADECSGCGQPLSESLHVDGRPDPEYSNHVMICAGCKAQERGRVKQEATDGSAGENEGLRIMQASRKWVLRRDS